MQLATVARAQLPVRRRVALLMVRGVVMRSAV